MTKSRKRKGCARCADQRKRERRISRDATDAMREVLFWMGVDHISLTDPGKKGVEAERVITSPAEFVAVLTEGLRRNEGDMFLQHAFAEWRMAARRFQVLVEDMNHHMGEVALEDEPTPSDKERGQKGASSKVQ